MNFQKFNQNLVQISNLYELSQLLRQKLSSHDQQQVIQSLHQQLNLRTVQNKQVFNEEVVNTKIEEKGYIQKLALLKIINNHQCHPQIMFCIDHLNLNFKYQYSIQQVSCLFPYQKISFSALVGACLQSYNAQICIEQNQSTKCKFKPLLQDKSDLSILELVFTIIKIELYISKTRKEIIPLIELYIPMEQKNLTQQQLNEYMLCQNLTSNLANSRYIIQALNGGKTNPNYLQYELNVQTNKPHKKQQKQNFNHLQQRNTKENINKIQQVMQRLNKRVNNFGKQWLISNPSTYVNTSIKSQKQN